MYCWIKQEQASSYPLNLSLSEILSLIFGGAVREWKDSCIWENMNNSQAVTGCQ